MGIQDRLGRVGAGALLFFAFVLPSTTVAAQAGGAQTTEEARRLFQSGRQAYEDGLFDAALDYFQRSYELSHRPELLFNIGTAADRLRRDELALSSFEAYLEALPAAENGTQVRARIEILRANITNAEAANETPAPTTTDSTAQVAAGLVLSGLGVVGLGVGWGLYVDSRGALDEFRGDAPTEAGFLTRQEALDIRESAVYWIAAGAGLLTTVGLPLWLPEENGTPWWSWLLGALGLGAIGGGIAAMVVEGECIDQACTRRDPLGSLGGLLLGHGVPLLSVPFIYLIRDATGGGQSDDSVEVSVSPSAGGAQLSVGGNW